MARSDSNTFDPTRRLPVRDLVLYQESAEIHAAVHAVADIAVRFAAAQEGRVALDVGPQRNLFAELIHFFAEDDRLRTDQIIDLKARVVQLLQTQVGWVSSMVRSREYYQGQIEAIDHFARIAQETEGARVWSALFSEARKNVIAELKKLTISERKPK